MSEPKFKVLVPSVSAGEELDANYPQPMMSLKRRRLSVRYRYYLNSLSDPTERDRKLAEAWRLCECDRE